MITKKIKGFFNCRRYDKSGKLSQAQRALIADGETITLHFSWALDEVPDWLHTANGLDDFAKRYVSKRERDRAEAENRVPVEDRVILKIKVGTGCRWYDKNARQIDKPTNADLEGRQWWVRAECTRKPKDPKDPMKACGYWANALMIEAVETNPFLDFVDGTDETLTPTDVLPFD